MEESVKLPASSFDEVAKIIASYAKLDKESSLAEISKLTSMHKTKISGNNGFLLGVGVIEGGNKKSITPIGKKLGLAIEHEHEDDTAALWREIVDDNSFLHNLVSAVRIRRGMDAGALRAHVAYSAGQSKTGPVMTGAGCIIEILKKSGWLEEQDGKLVAAAEQEATGKKEVEKEARLSDSRGQILTDSVERTVITSQASGVQVSIQVRVNCTLDDLDGLGAKLKKVIAEVSSLNQIEPASDAED